MFERTTSAEVIVQPRLEGPVSSVAHLVGNTPLLDLSFLSGSDGPRVLAKLEMHNPAGSAKDRPAQRMIRRALAEGRIRAGDVVVESSSGNLGVALAQQCSVAGLRFVCVVDPRTNDMARKLMAAYGADVVCVDRPDPVTGDWLAARIGAVADILATTPRAWWPNQYANTENANAHRDGTAAEIVSALGTAPRAVFVATSSTGTLVGIQSYVRTHDHPTQVVAVDAIGSVLFQGVRAPRALPGFGAGVVPELAAHASPDLVVRVDDLACVVGCRRMARGAAVLVGASAGGVVQAFESHRERYGPGETVVLVLHDGGAGYLDTVFDDDWVSEHLGTSPQDLRRLVDSPRAARVA